MRFFVSYSRSVKEEVRKVIDLLRASGHEVWWDADIPVIADWWATILKNIELCEVFIFVVSEKSVQSAYCVAELKYASDKQRPIVPFIIDDTTKYSLPAELPSRGQWLLYNGDPAEMLIKINTACKNIEWKLHKNLDIKRPPEPLTGGKSLAKQYQEARQLANDGQMEEAQTIFKNIKRIDYGEWGEECDEWLARITSYLPIVELASDNSTMQKAYQAWGKHVKTFGNGFDPDKLGQKLSVQSKRSISILLGTGFALVLAGVSIIMSIYAVSSGLGSSNTPTPTPNPLEEAGRLAMTPMTSNATWQNLYPNGFVQEFSGVPMVLVPAGCFQMGNDPEAYYWNGDNYTESIPDGGQQCFDEPFWIDQIKVTQAQFSNLGGIKDNENYFVGVNRPVDSISWFEARDYCENQRSGRLPTESEWEYAARGPDALYFPWGNEWNDNNAVWRVSSTADGGSILAGASWVGALDMTGNLWEWTRSVYEDYPYVANDGREDNMGNSLTVQYTLRGGSWKTSITNVLRLAARDAREPIDAVVTGGFRCILAYNNSEP